MFPFEERTTSNLPSFVIILESSVVSGPIVQLVRIASIDAEEEEKEIETTTITPTTATATATNPKSESTKENEKEKEKKKKNRKSGTKGGKTKSQSIAESLKKEKPIKLHSLAVPEPLLALAYPCEQMVRKIPTN